MIPWDICPYMALTVGFLVDIEKSDFQSFPEIGIIHEAVSEKKAKDFNTNFYSHFACGNDSCQCCKRRRNVPNENKWILINQWNTLFRETLKITFLKVESNPTVYAIYGHVSSAAILYTKPKGLYFDLVKYHGDWSSHSGVEICAQIVVDWWTRCRLKF